MHYSTCKRDTKEYKGFKYDVKIQLAKSGFKVNASDKYKLSLIVGYSSKLSDLDNAFKPTLDAMQLSLGFDDRQVFEIAALKNHVKKGDEYMLIRLETITDRQWLSRMHKLFPSWEGILSLLPTKKASKPKSTKDDTISKQNKGKTDDTRNATTDKSSILRPTTW